VPDAGCYSRAFGHISNTKLVNAARKTVPVHVLPRDPDPRDPVRSFNLATPRSEQEWLRRGSCASVRLASVDPCIS
jgi:hypothetical protein